MPPRAREGQLEMKALAVLLALAAPLGLAAEEAVRLDSAPIDPRDVASLQSGARSVARTIAIDVADLRVTERRLPARAQIHVVLRREERIRDVDDPISIDIAARDLRRRGCGAARGRATRRGGRLSRRRGQGGARRGRRCRRLGRW